MFPSGDPGVSGDFWGSQEGCQGNPVGEGTTRRGTATPVHRPQRRLLFYFRLIEEEKENTEQWAEETESREGRGSLPSVPAPLPLSPFSPPDRDKRGDSPAWSGRGQTVKNPPAMWET